MKMPQWNIAGSRLWTAAEPLLCIPVVLYMQRLVVLILFQEPTLFIRVHPVAFTVVMDTREPALIPVLMTVPVDAGMCAV